MIERLSQRRKSEGGFTLVELLVVIVILGILAAIVVFAVGGISDKGQTSACAADKSSISAAEEALFAQTSAYGNMTALVTGGFLHEASTLYTVAPVDGPPKSYTFTPIGNKCT